VVRPRPSLLLIFLGLSAWAQDAPKMMNINTHLALYKVCADDGNLYILGHHAAADEWRLESFRRLR
jgi:hypothetical protein